MRKGQGRGSKEIVSSFCCSCFGVDWMCLRSGFVVMTMLDVMAGVKILATAVCALMTLMTPADPDASISNTY